MNARRFQWLQKPAGEPEGDDIFLPSPDTLPGAKSHGRRIFERRAVKAAKQQFGRLFLAEVGARIDEAISDPVL